MLFKVVIHNCKQPDLFIAFDFQEEGKFEMDILSAFMTAIALFYTIIAGVISSMKLGQLI